MLRKHEQDRHWLPSFIYARTACVACEYNTTSGAHRVKVVLGAQRAPRRLLEWVSGIQVGRRHRTRVDLKKQRWLLSA
jgi:hypothetical protein